MKTTTKLFALVLALPLLAGCGKTKEPKFKNFGEQVSFEDFFGGYQLRMTELEFGKEDPLGSRELKAVTQATITQETTRKGDTAMKSSVEGKKTDVYQYDSESKIFRNTEKMTYDIRAKAPIGEEHMKLQSDEEHLYQRYSEGGESYAINVDVKGKGYKSVLKCTEAMPYDKYIDMQVKDRMGYGLISDFSSVVARYQTASDEVKAKYTFFKNENVYSIAFGDNTNEDIKNGADEVVANKTVEYHLKVQVDLGDDLTFASFEDKHTTTQYQKEYDDHTAFDCVDQHEVSSTEGGVTEFKKSLKEADLSGYIKYGIDW